MLAPPRLRPVLVHIVISLSVLFRMWMQTKACMPTRCTLVVITRRAASSCEVGQEVWWLDVVFSYMRGQLL